MCELRQGGPKKSQNGIQGGTKGSPLEANELAGDIILGCSDGALVIYDVKAKPRNIAIVGGIHVTDTKSGLTPESLQERRWIVLNNIEPITHVFEYLPSGGKSGPSAGDVDNLFDFSSSKGMKDNSK